MKTSVSVVIVTKNRGYLLKECLLSLTRQTVLPAEVIIIDNNSSDNTRDIIKKYSKKLKIISKIVEYSNFPLLYNSGIELASSDFIAFIDDDCYAIKTWIEVIISSHNQNMNSVIQGSVLSIPKDNIYALIMGHHYQNWLKSHIKENGCVDVIDTKNVSFPKTLIKKNLFLINLNLGSHDIELGKRITNKNIPILLKSEMLVTHRERTTYVSFILQHWRIAQSEAKANNYLNKNDKINFIFSKKNKLTSNWLILRIFSDFKTHQYLDIIKLLIVYVSLFIVRIIGYIIGSLK